MDRQIKYTTKTKQRQELSYWKWTARHLRTQYVEGIYDNPVTLKSICAHYIRHSISQ